MSMRQPMTLIFLLLAGLCGTAGASLSTDSERETPERGTPEREAHAAAAPGGTAPAQGKPAALICWLLGEATVQTPGGDRLPLALFDRLSPGDVLRTARGAAVTLVFADGRRFTVEAESRVAVTAGGVAVETGALRPLAPVPALARLPRIAAEELPGQRPGAGRIRYARLGGDGFSLEPRDEAAVLHDDATLVFSPVAGVEQYRVEVLDDAGEQLFAADTQATRLRLPAAVLRPGEPHYWRVSSGSGERRRLHGGAYFLALTGASTAARHELAEQARRDGDPGLRLLLAAVDRSLGLERSACDGLAGVAGTAPHPALATAAERLGCADRP